MAKEPGFLRSRPRPAPTQLPYRIRSAGMIDRQAMHSTRGTHHSDAMLTLVTAGRGFYHCGGRREVVSAGSIGLVLPGIDPGILMADPDDPYRHYYCRFAGDLALAVAERVRRGRPAFWSAEDPEALAAILDELVAWHRRGPAVVGDEPDTPTPAEAVLAKLLAVLQFPASTPNRSITAASLRRYLTDRLSEPLVLETMAEDLAVSVSHLCRVAKRELGRTLGQEAQAIKVEWAQVLLQESSLSVKEVAARVGYRDPLYFSRVFRRVVGSSPSAWRKPDPGHRA